MADEVVLKIKMEGEGEGSTTPLPEPKPVTGTPPSQVTGGGSLTVGTAVAGVSYSSPAFVPAPAATPVVNPVPTGVAGPGTSGTPPAGPLTSTPPLDASNFGVVPVQIVSPLPLPVTGDFGKSGGGPGGGAGGGGKEAPDWMDRLAKQLMNKDFGGIGKDALGAVYGDMAGPIMMALGMAKDAVVAFGTGVRDTSIAVARNDLSGAFKASSDAFLDTVTALNPELAVFSYGIKTARDAVMALNDAFMARAREIAGYSAPTAAAFAQSDVRQILMDIKESRVLGDEMSKLVSLNSDISIAVQEALLPIKEYLLTKLNAFLEFVKDILDESVVPAIVKIPVFIEGFPAVIAAFVTPMKDGVKAAQDLKKAMNDAVDEWRAKLEKPMDPFIDDVLKMFTIPEGANDRGPDAVMFDGAQAIQRAQRPAFQF